MVAITAGLLIALALGSIFILLATLTAGLAGVLVLGGLAPASLIAQSASSGVAGQPRAQRAVEAADGSIRQALTVPAETV
jgi:hypothetical protein